MDIKYLAGTLRSHSTKVLIFYYSPLKSGNLIRWYTLLMTAVQIRYVKRRAIKT